MLILIRKEGKKKKKKRGGTSVREVGGEVSVPKKKANEKFESTNL